MTEQVRPDPALVAGTVLDDAPAGLVRNYADALISAAGDEAGAVVDELDAIV
ncbi:MAG TPA: hypothetical protein VGH33_14550 [Isosphaeraceae bacterium]